MKDLGRLQISYLHMRVSSENSSSTASRCTFERSSGCALKTGGGISSCQLSVPVFTPHALFANANADIYPGHVAFFSFISELKQPESYPKALYLLQGVDISMYLIVAIVTYRYAGSGVASPALGSTNATLSKIAYGIAIPTIIIAGVINGHVAAKYIYVRMFRGTDRMSKRNWSSFGLWALIVLVLWIVAWIIASAIPVFNDLLGLISALFASWFTYGLSGLFWLFMNKGRYRESSRKMFLTALNAVIFCIGGVIVSRLSQLVSLCFTAG